MPLEYSKSFPYEIKAEKTKLPLAYLPLGLLEWHGEHNVYGLDAVKAEFMCKYFADIFGGIVMPTMYYGENRDDICENVFKPERVSGCSYDHTAQICEKCGYKQSDIDENAKRAVKNDDGWELWKNLIVHTLFTFQSLGFKYIVLIPGHYPFFGQLEFATKDYAARGGTAKTVILWDMMYDKDGVTGDHAAMFETSVMMHFDSSLVNLKNLDSDLAKPCIGVLGKDPRTHASAKLGGEIMEGMAEILREQLHEMMSH